MLHEKGLASALISAVLPDLGNHSMGSFQHEAKGQKSAPASPLFVVPREVSGRGCGWTTCGSPEVSERDFGTQTQIPGVQEECLSPLPNFVALPTGHVRPGLDALFPERKKVGAPTFLDFPLYRHPLPRVPRVHALLFPAMLLTLSLELPRA